MTVFYGTDRLPLENVGPTAASYLTWIAGTATCAVAVVLLVILAIRLRRRWFLMTGCALGAVVTAVLTLVAGLKMPTAAASPSLARVYGNDRGPMEMGTCQVSIPKCHEVGEVERPSILRLQFREDPTQHVVLLEVTPEASDAFFTKLRNRIEGSPNREAFVFVHGFSVTFEAAARRTAQLAYDLKFEGAPIFYSWPSQGGLLQYTVDETNVAWTVSHLKEFLTDVARRSGAQSVHLIAHSMGNRALTAALQTLDYEVKSQIPKFGQVVLTAPDIDADIFRRDIAPAIVRMANRVTLYASSNDEALMLSKQIHGYPRAGDSGTGMLVIPGIDTIDVSSVDTSLIGHSYYGSNHTVLEDLWDLLHESRPPAQRQWLHPMQLGKMMYWVFLTEQARRQAAGMPRTGL
jgi:esterase/lipase superfamily enzyme